MATTTGNRHPRSPADQGRTRHVLLGDDRGQLTLRRLRPWHRLLARCAAARLDRELAAGASPETSATLAARAMQLTSVKVRRDLATSIQRILGAAGELADVMPSPAAAVHPPRLPLRRARISQSAVPLARLAGYLTAPGPVPVQGVAIISQLLADGTGPLYREACANDLTDIVENAVRALTGSHPTPSATPLPHAGSGQRGPLETGGCDPARVRAGHPEIDKDWLQAEPDGSRPPGAPSYTCDRCQVDHGLFRSPGSCCGRSRCPAEWIGPAAVPGVVHTGSNTRTFGARHAGTGSKL